jgi:hypothetical protein
MAGGVQLAVALFLFWATSTFYAVSGVAVEEPGGAGDGASEPDQKSSVRVQVRAPHTPLQYRQHLQYLSGSPNSEYCTSQLTLLS